MCDVYILFLQLKNNINSKNNIKMKKRYRNSYNHARVETYKVTWRPGYKNFIIHPHYLHEENLKFVYEVEGKQVEKVIPVTYLGPHLKTRMFFSKDEATLFREFRGWAYEIPEEIVFNY